MMTFDTGTFSSACKPGAKPREKIEDDEPVVDSITEKVNRAERLSKEKENRRLRQAKAKEDRKRQTMRKKQQEKRTDGGPQTLGKGLRGTSDKKVPRGKVRVNPVTGALETITQDNDDPNYVREGCMRIHKKYMNAAVEAGLVAALGGDSALADLEKIMNRTWEKEAEENPESPVAELKGMVTPEYLKILEVSSKTNYLLEKKFNYTADSGDIKNVS